MTLNSKKPYSIRQVTKNSVECRMARDLQAVLGYSSWENFLNAIDKAKTNLDKSGFDSKNHFHETVKLVNIGSGAERLVKDSYMSRLACYLTALNADPRLPKAAEAESYFAVQTRKRELEQEKDEDFSSKELKKRVLLRTEMKEHNKKLAQAAKESGVVEPLDYAIFQDWGYKGLYGGLGQKDIHKKKP